MARLNLALIVSLLIAAVAAADEPQKTPAEKEKAQETAPAHEEQITVVGYYSRYGAETTSSAIRLEVPLAELPQSVGVVRQAAPHNPKRPTRPSAGLLVPDSTAATARLPPQRGYPTRMRRVRFCRHPV